jgi:hypothetical protein
VVSSLAGELRPVVHPDSPEKARGNGLGTTSADTQQLLAALAQASTAVNVARAGRRDEVLKQVDPVMPKAR